MKRVYGIDIKNIKGFPLENPKAIVVIDRKKLRVIEHHYFWDKKANRGKTKDDFLGYIVGNECKFPIPPKKIDLDQKSRRCQKAKAPGVRSGAFAFCDF